VTLRQELIITLSGVRARQLQTVASSSWSASSNATRTATSCDVTTGRRTSTIETENPGRPLGFVGQLEQAAIASVPARTAMTLNLI
jgi:hypothetical protein